MELTINHQKKIYDNKPLTLAALLQSEAPGKSKGIAIAINNRVIPRSLWASTALQDKDAVLIITATQGG